ncbi:MAG TPA: ACP S-malonyltransferase [Candidatus Merdicola faecigallinarum]|uniref:Malonyl CoA-acyl carrier protein transacylase n=1 Tax=Candidatus Merdicola faecigallinarum TaxID=2840862 RepID=A0A9D1M0B6_9FIRM|nr:ACP S-malonyltransferase [Candidatus Merdicola faecigallinarum]
MKIAFMFPGQGAQTVGMGKDLYEHYEEVRKVYEEASKIAGKDIAKLTFESSLEELSKTENAQLAIATMSIGILELLKKENIVADIAVGLSLGEYPALMYGGYIRFEDGINLLRHRGYFMGNLVPKEKYAMAAIIGLESSKIEEVCAKIREEGVFVVPANYNYSAQTVISGEEEGIEKAIEMLKESGAKKAIKLQTSGPFHTSKLEEARKAYKKELEKVSFQEGNIKVIKNLDGTIYKASDDMQEILANHIVSPVRFDKAIKLMEEEGIDTFVEIGPGKALSGFIKKEKKDANVFNIDNIENLTKVIEALKQLQ